MPAFPGTRRRAQASLPRNRRPEAGVRLRRPPGFATTPAAPPPPSSARGTLLVLRIVRLPPVRAILKWVHPDRYRTALDRLAPNRSAHRFLQRTRNGRRLPRAAAFLAELHRGAALPCDRVAAVRRVGADRRAAAVAIPDSNRNGSARLCHVRAAARYGAGARLLAELVPASNWHPAIQPGCSGAAGQAEQAGVTAFSLAPEILPRAEPVPRAALPGPAIRPDRPSRRPSGRVLAARPTRRGAGRAGGGVLGAGCCAAGDGSAPNAEINEFQ